ncbi:hypothetical protein B7494_g1482 [Chlorociboria aeruginascens]|nr:hypothetical protein B7494_g1482 [Chlorociboria aeruginascens]
MFTNLIPFITYVVESLLDIIRETDLKSLLLRKPIRHSTATYKLPEEITLLILGYLEPHQQFIVSLTNVHFHRAYHRLHPNVPPFDLRMETADSRAWSMDWNLFSREYMHDYITSKNRDVEPQLYQLIWDDPTLWGNYWFCYSCAKMKLPRCWDLSFYEEEQHKKYPHNHDFRYLTRESENWCMKCRVKYLLVEWDDRTENIEQLPGSTDVFICKGHEWAYSSSPDCGMVHVGCEMCDFTKEDALERLETIMPLSRFNGLELPAYQQISTSIFAMI